MMCIGSRIKKCIFASFSVGALILVACSQNEALPPPPDINASQSEKQRAFEAGLAEAAERVSGKILFHRTYKNREGIRDSFIVEVGSQEVRMLAKNAKRPKWSPDGKKVAFIREPDQIMLIDEDGSNEKVLATAEDPYNIAFHPNGQEVLFIDKHQNAIQTVHIESGEVRTLLEGRTFLEPWISQDGNNLVCTVKHLGGYHVRGYDLRTGENWKIGKGCSATITLDGTRVSNNLHGHLELAIRDFKTGEELNRISAPEGYKFDNQSMACNHPDWLMSAVEGACNALYLHHIPSNWNTRIVDVCDGDYPQIFVTQ